ncbi:hypothetical protein [Bacillus thuringiensis]|uniref:hypothetical protein n=1 Tax=Bacillus thuringiensis TaxID=1428 RepID=UPI0021D68C19|nr:hypothetical protein [Bacillus thuringiensis]MCU7667186.1 hypothetical protein [Bacillus thuringiensis]
MEIEALIVQPKEDVLIRNLPCTLEVFEGVLGGSVSLMDLPYGYLLICKENENEVKQLNKVILRRNIEDAFIVVKKDGETGSVIGVEEEKELLVDIFSKEHIVEEDFDVLINGLC